VLASRGGVLASMRRKKEEDEELEGDKTRLWFCDGEYVLVVKGVRILY
jgi:hypothetical protein